MFSDDTLDCFPFDAIEEQLTVWDRDHLNRQMGLYALRGMVSCLEDQKETNVYDILSLCRRSSEPYTIAFLCLVLQLTIPIVLGCFLVADLVRFVPQENTRRWRALCVPISLCEWQLRCAVNKISSVLLLVYTVRLIWGKWLLISSKPTIYLLQHGLAFDSRIMSNRGLNILGYFVNVYSLCACALVVLIVVYHSKEPLEIVLNSLAIFFVLDIDNLLVSKVDLAHHKARIQAYLDRCVDDPSIPVIRKSRKLYLPFKLSRALFILVSLLVFLSTGYVLYCKV